MKVLDLQCSHQHAFEGWFASEGDFQSQLGRGLVTCPLCGDPTIRKMPSAPRLNLGASASEPALASGSRALSLPAAASAGGPTQDVVAVAGEPDVQAGFLKALRHVLANTEDVGQRFADEARAMHYGDAEQRSIRGQASRAEAIELIEEGIEVMPLPLPEIAKETLQ
ncbi:MAG: DUF1178 family protein [Pseudomonadota bacterium]|uniref:DUF1178 family protein n=1 Tax=Polaromonas sp. TaxID=1869339 RepID=UPI0017B02552|nr:DUF1178 family protein [Polaromonas sp.]MBA3593975.1 DUF1178 family protein [Polaromonas sp.]MDQ3270817.1 DUF1178 family protein [Pseudomonadota bacterium]